MSDDRKALIRRYKETPLLVGVFRVRNIAEKRSFVGTSVNLSGMLNRMRFQLEMGSHPNTALQSDWDTADESNFTFEVLDTLEPPENPDYDPTDDLSALRTIWTERLVSEGERIYS